MPIDSQLLKQIETNAKNLTQVNLRSNHLGDEGAKALAAALEKNQTVTQVNLGFNSIGAEGAQALAAILEMNQSLTQVNLSDNSIGAEGVKALAAALEKNKTLTQVNLSWNSIGAEGAQALAAALEKNQALTQVDLFWNSIGDEGATALAAALEKNKALTRVDLSFNSIGDEGATALAAALEKNKTLMQVELSWNGIGAELESQIQQTVKKNETQAEALIQAVQAGDLGKVKQLVEHGVAVNYQDEQGNTALHYAAQHPAIATYQLAQPQQVLLRNKQDELPKGLQQKPQPNPVSSIVIPDDYLCRITDQLMYEPVMAGDGESYEKEAIEAWLATHSTSPVTGEPLALQLMPNKALKRLIQDWLEKHPEVKDSPDYYLPVSIKQDVIKAVHIHQPALLKRLLTSSAQLLTQALNTKPLTAKKSLSTGNKQQNMAASDAPLSSSSSAAPIYLLPLVCEQGDKACLEVVLTALGQQLHTIAKDPDSLLQLIAQHQPDNILVLGQALGYQPAGYLRLLQDKPDYQTVWLKGYLAGTSDIPAALHTLAIRAIEQGQLKLLQQVVTLGLSLQTVDAKGNTLLHLAAQHNQQTIALWLMQQGCSDKALNHQQQRPRDLAKPYPQLATALIKAHQQHKFGELIASLQAEIKHLRTEVCYLKSELMAKQGLFAQPSAPVVDVQNSEATRLCHLDL